MYTYLNYVRPTTVVDPIPVPGPRLSTQILRFVACLPAGPRQKSFSARDCWTLYVRGTVCAIDYARSGTWLLSTWSFGGGIGPLQILKSHVGWLTCVLSDYRFQVLATFQSDQISWSSPLCSQKLVNVSYLAKMTILILQDTILYKVQLNGTLLSLFVKVLGIESIALVEP